jgi:hypothetical protein
LDHHEPLQEVLSFVIDLPLGVSGVSTSTCLEKNEKAKRPRRKDARLTKSRGLARWRKVQF